MNDAVNKLIETISAVEMPNVFNPWRHTDELDVPACQGGDWLSRRNRLFLHFKRRPRFLLVGEAPGYQGCHFSGVPFTSERMMFDGMVPDLRWNRFTKRLKPWSEPSATIVWKTLHDFGIAAQVVMWNAFAWHPHRPGEPHSNRTPTRNELLAGAQVLEKVVQLFDGAQVVAVGLKAQNLLKALGVAGVSCVRHPSMGGATQFRAGLKAIVEATDA